MNGDSYLFTLPKVKCKSNEERAFYLNLAAQERWSVRDPFEAPSIGVLLCKTPDTDVVQFALNRTLSPALVADYETKLPDKHLLQAKLEAFYDLASQRKPWRMKTDSSAFSP